MTLFAQLPGVYTNADPSHPTHRFYASYAQPATGDKVRHPPIHPVDEGVSCLFMCCLLAFSLLYYTTV